MAVPKRKTSKARKNKRRSHIKLATPSLSRCPRCHSFKAPHVVCGNCGFYAGREVIKSEDEV